MLIPSVCLLDIREEQYVLRRHPVLFCGATLDCVSSSEVFKGIALQLCPKATVREYERDHWLLLDDPGDLNRDLLAWMRSVTQEYVQVSPFESK